MTGAVPKDPARTERSIEAIETIYSTVSEPSLWPAALQAIADVTEDVGAVLVFARDDGRFGVIESPRLSPMIQEFRTTFQGEDLRAIRARERGLYLGRDTVTDRDLASHDEMETHPQYLFLKKFGLKFCAAVSVSPDPHFEAAISVQRAFSKSPFDDAELEAVGTICRHAEPALRLSIRLVDAELSNIGLREALSRLGIGVFALDSLSRVVFANAAGEALLGDGVEVRDGRLRIVSTSSREAIEAAIAAALKAEPGASLEPPRAMLAQRVREARPLAVYVVPIIGAPAWSRALARARILLLVVDPKPNEPFDPGIVRDVLGVTLGEARVASLIATGLTAREAGTKLGVTEETARTVLKRVYAKIGISRQSELAALLTRLVLR